MSEEVLTSSDALEALAPRWSELEKLGAVHTPFQSLPWLRHWLRARSEAAEPFLLHLADEGIVAPLWRRKVRGVRVLRFLGSPQSDYEQLVCPGDPAAAWPRVGAALQRLHREWDLLLLDFAPRASEPASALAAVGGQRPHRSDHESCPFALTHVPWSAFLQRRRREARHGLRRWESRLAERGAVSVERWSSPLSVLQLETLSGIEGDSWKQRAGSGLLQPEQRAGLLHRFLTGPDSTAQTWLLRVGDLPVAFNVALVHERNWYCYWNAYRQGFPHSGALLLGRILEAACAAGCERVDFLRGSERYKFVWSDGANSVDHLAWSSSALGAAAAQACEWRWKLGRSALLTNLRTRIRSLWP